jgi:hypothetical protein
VELEKTQFAGFAIGARAIPIAPGMWDALVAPPFAAEIPKIDLFPGQDDDARPRPCHRARRSRRIRNENRKRESEYSGHCPSLPRGKAGKKVKKWLTRGESGGKAHRFAQAPGFLASTGIKTRSCVARAQPLC